jgi:hypothetical protein
MFDELKFLNFVEAMMEEKDDPSVFTEVTNPTLPDFAHLHLVHGDSEKQTSYRLRTSPDQRTDADDASFLERMDGYRRVVIPRLPSWAPNWAQRRLSCPVPGDYDMPETEGLRPYRASGSLKSSASFTAIKNGVLYPSYTGKDVDGHQLYQLKTKGRLLGTVSVVGSDFYGSDPTLIATEAACIVISTRVLTPGQSNYEALLRTLVGDRNADGTLL